MPLTAPMVRSMLRERGWTNADLAAHWGHSISYVSWLVNTPNERPRVYDDAFRGLLPRSQVEVHLEPRHRKKKAPKKWTIAEMYPPGRVFITQNGRLGPEEGTELVVRAIRRAGDEHLVTFQILSGDAQGDVLEIAHGQDTDSLDDTGQDELERRQMA